MRITFEEYGIDTPPKVVTLTTDEVTICNGYIEFYTASEYVTVPIENVISLRK